VTGLPSPLEVEMTNLSRTPIGTASVSVSWEEHVIELVKGIGSERLIVKMGIVRRTPN
jgi:hypothetical protein